MPRSKLKIAKTSYWKTIKLFLLREVKEDLKKREHISCLWIERFSFVKMFIFPQTDYDDKFNVSVGTTGARIFGQTLLQVSL